MAPSWRTVAASAVAIAGLFLLLTAETDLTYYDRVGVPENADLAVIKKACESQPGLAALFCNPCPAVDLLLLFPLEFANLAVPSMSCPLPPLSLPPPLSLHTALAAGTQLALPCLYMYTPCPTAAATAALAAALPARTHHLLATHAVFLYRPRQGDAAAPGQEPRREALAAAVVARG